MRHASPSQPRPPLTNHYKFLSEMDLVLSPIGKCLTTGTPVTMAGGLTMPADGLITPIVEVGGLPARPIEESAAFSGGLTSPPRSLTARVAKDSCATAHVGEADGPTAPSSGPTAWLHLP
jgi:hypothetical protein